MGHVGGRVLAAPPTLWFNIVPALFTGLLFVFFLLFILNHQNYKNIKIKKLFIYIF